ncbi:MAG TPA: 2Fe-2S iron-sulfur cluster-binding protein, partial [Acidimicrobiia bacterium]|nr:2Fe-2S iron-sulfur cluster-binding protein [Acidimicrobiia bacterium]
MQITISLNGAKREFDVPPYYTLLRLLRKQGLFSVRFGSETGETGAAAVLFDGKLASADILLAAQADGHEVITVESLSRGTDLHPIQSAFAATGAIQSGYSIPAMVLGALALLERDPDPSEEAIRDMLSGILDRETAYVKPVEAVKRAAALMRGEQPEPFRPLVLAPMTDGVHPVEVDPTDPRPIASPAVPRLVPSKDVPDMQVVGKPEIKVDALKLVKGNPAFTDDIELRDMLYAKVMRSPHAHARIVDIDDSRARALPGVHEVLHYQNTPHIRYASGGQSWPNPKPYDQVSFDNKVRHVGDRVAAVAAETLEIAEQAIRLIDVTYEVLPAVFEENEAIRGDAPVIHDEEDADGIYDASRNIARHMQVQVGDVDTGFEQADHVFERTFRVHQVQQAPIEPHITIGWFDAD